MKVDLKLIFLALFIAILVSEVDGWWGGGGSRRSSSSSPSTSSRRRSWGWRPRPRPRPRPSARARVIARARARAIARARARAIARARARARVNKLKKVLRGLKNKLSKTARHWKKIVRQKSKRLKQKLKQTLRRLKQKAVQKSRYLKKKLKQHARKLKNKLRRLKKNLKRKSKAALKKLKQKIRMVKWKLKRRFGKVSYPASVTSPKKEKAFLGIKIKHIKEVERPLGPLKKIRRTGIKNHDIKHTAVVVTDTKGQKYLIEKSYFFMKPKTRIVPIKSLGSKWKTIRSKNVKGKTMNTYVKAIRYGYSVIGNNCQVTSDKLFKQRKRGMCKG